MNTKDYKCVLIIDETLNVGTISNVAAVLSISIGSKITSLIGPDVIDRSEVLHPGLTKLPIPVLGATSVQLNDIRNNILSMCLEDMLLFDFNNFAQQAKTYEEYISGLQSAEPADIVYMGIGLYGKKKFVNIATQGLKLIGA
jgi:hypothetical protein